VDANRVAETVAFKVIRCDWALVDAADAVTDRAIAAQLNRHSDLDDRMAVGLALRRARVLEAGESQAAEPRMAVDLRLNGLSGHRRGRAWKRRAHQMCANRVQRSKPRPRPTSDWNCRAHLQPP